MVPHSSHVVSNSYGVRLTYTHVSMFANYVRVRVIHDSSHTADRRDARFASPLSLSLSLSLSRCSLNCVWPLSLAHEGDLSRLGHRLSPLTIADSLTSGELSSLALLVHVLAYPRRALHLIMDGRSGQLSSTGRVRGRRACAQLHRRESRLRPLGAAPSRPTQPTAGGASSASLPASGPCSYDELPAPP